MLPRVSNLMLKIDNLSGDFLISLERQRCSFCSNSLTWIIKHINNGSLALVVNKPPEKKKSSNPRIKNHIFITRVKIRDFEPSGRSEPLLAHSRDLKETNSLKKGVGNFLSIDSSSMFLSNYSAPPLLGDTGFWEWIPAQSESEITANMCFITSFNRKIVRYAQ